MFTTRRAEKPGDAAGCAEGGLGPSGRSRRRTGPRRPGSPRSTDARPVARRRDPGNLPPSDRLNWGPQTHRYIPQRGRRPAASGPDIDALRAGRGADTLRHLRVATPLRELPPPHAGQSQARPQATPLADSYPEFHLHGLVRATPPVAHPCWGAGGGASRDWTELAAGGGVTRHAPVLCADPSPASYLRPAPAF